MTPTWHTEYSKVILNKWYDDWEHWLLTAEEWKGMKLSYPNTVAYCNRQALKCKVLGIVWHDRYKLLLEK